MDKSALRKEIKMRLLSLSDAYLEEAGRKIEEKIISSGFFEESESVFVYVSTENEPSTKRIIQHALENGKRVFVPKSEKSGQMKAVEISLSTVFSPGLFDIPEPTDDKAEIGYDFDIALIPCVSASRNGNRLGHGKGYYDHFLCGKKMKKVCLCFEKLLSDSIPKDKNDVGMDVIVTENEIINTNI